MTWFLREGAMPDASDYQADQETLWLTFLAPHRIKLRDIAPVESGMGQFWRSRYGVSWPGLVLASATESDGGFLCSVWLQLTRDRANRASPPFVSDFAAVIQRVTAALRASALPAAEDCRAPETARWLVAPTRPQPKPSVWPWPDYGIRAFLHAMRPLRVGIGTHISIIQPTMRGEGGGHDSAPLVNIVVRGGEWRALCRTYEALTRPAQPPADDDRFISSHQITDYESQ
jgi:hypothetical protein